MKKLQVKRVAAAALLAALGLLVLAAPSWAQAPYVNPRNTNLETPSGCVIVYSLGSASKTTLLRAEGRCVNGLAEGEWIYSVRDIYNNNDATALESVNVRWFKEGQAFGLSIRLSNKNWASISSIEPSFEGTHYSARVGDGGEAVSLSALYQKIDQAVAVSRQKNLPVNHAATAKNLAKQWLDDRQGLHAKWVVPSSSAQFNKAGSSRDDPKTTGRGARGG